MLFPLRSELEWRQKTNKKRKTKKNQKNGGNIFDWFPCSTKLLLLPNNKTRKKTGIEGLSPYLHSNCCYYCCYYYYYCCYYYCCLVLLVFFYLFGVGWFIGKRKKVKRNFFLTIYQNFFFFCLDRMPSYCRLCGDLVKGPKCKCGAGSYLSQSGHGIVLPSSILLHSSILSSLLLLFFLLFYLYLLLVFF